MTASQLTRHETNDASLLLSYSLMMNSCNHFFFTNLHWFFLFICQSLCDNYWHQINQPRTSWVLHISVLLIEECQNYQTLTDTTRKTSYAILGEHCDNLLRPGWFRFQNPAGTKMPTSCVPRYRCGTDAPGWLNGAHPKVSDGRVARQVCFHWESNCCMWSVSIQVRNCGSFYIYYLKRTPACRLRFCGAGYSWQAVGTHFWCQLHFRIPWHLRLVNYDILPILCFSKAVFEFYGNQAYITHIGSCLLY